MSLVDVKDYLKKRRRASIGDLSIHFRTSSSALEPMLEYWVNKGSVQKVAHEGCCHGTHVGCSCGGNHQEWYEWTGG